MQFWERLADCLLRGRAWLFLLGLALTALAYGPSRRLEFDRGIDNMFRKDDPRYEHYLEDRALFGNSETCFVAYDDPDLFTLAGLQRVDAFRERLLALSGVEGVLGLTNVRRPSAPFDSRSLTRQLESGDVAASALQAEILGTDLYVRRLVSEDGKTVVLWVELKPIDGDSATRAATIAAIRELCDTHSPPAVLAGGPVLVDDVFTYLEQDGQTLGWASSLILTVVIAVLFRNLRWILLPLAVVQVTLIWTKAILATSGMTLSMVSSPLVALVTVIGVATVVHVTIRFREDGIDEAPKNAFRRTLIHIVPAIFWTCLTTSAGFAALLACEIAPVRSFGIMMALGSGLVFFAVLLLSPFVAVSLPSLPTQPGKAPGEDKLSVLLTRIVVHVQHRPRRVMTVSALALAATSLGVLRLQVATDFTENFRESSRIVRSFHFLSDRLGAVNTFDILVDMPDGLSVEFETAMDDLRRLQTELELEPAIVDTASVADLLDFIKQAGAAKPSSEKPAGGVLHGLLRMIPKIPQRAQLLALDTFDPRLVAGFWNREHRVARIVVTARHIRGAAGKKEFVERVERISRQHFPAARTTGIFVLLTYVVQSLLADQWVTFAVSLAAIFLIMSFAFRSLRLGIIALIPNAAPIVMVVGTMGWLGLKVNMATAMLASVSMGLAVDFSIHYLLRFRDERRRGRDIYEALQAAHGSVGLAMVMSNLALIAGFLVLVMSALIPTVHFGILVSVAMLGGLAGNLVVLPLLLKWLAPSSVNDSRS